MSGRLIRMNALETLRMISKTLNEGDNLEGMLQAVLDALLETTGIESGWIFLMDESGQQQLVASSGLPAGLSHNECEPLRKGGCWCLNKYKNKELTHAINIMNCKRLEQATLHNLGSTNGMERHATIPIQAGEESFGLINVASPRIDQFTNQELELFETVAYQIGATVKRFRLFLQEQVRTKILSQFGKYIAIMKQETDERRFLEQAGSVMLTFFDWSGVQLSYGTETFFNGVKNRHIHKGTIELDGEELSLMIFSSHFSKESESLIQDLMAHLSLHLKQIQLEKKQQVIVRTEERNRLARDLHDSVNQLLFSLILHAKGLEKRVDDPVIQASVQSIHELGNEALKELKQLIYQLRPEGLEFGLVSAIKKYSELIGLQIEVQAKGLKALSEEREVCLWRVLQEAINNCKKHAATNKMRICLIFSEEKVEVFIEDKGVGFERKEIKKGVGISSMLERINEVGGSIQIDSNLGEGTKIAIILPIK
ncbi:GAF domain-containing sensor histidine kinase [Alkalihalobacillus sp. 1P02AB]|uniref:GAF domain-containing sensor histidine kinase n=1 Tax=Alkalihalobacillus sp. 1P02AB TaxID=3132260 RepID=UPI0039A6EBE5